ncbi:peptidoglycan-binding domain-containing protein [Amycolatopsis saalfeldensis]|uniref:Putative peptidoglycan binding domain-containing protein n=1 Tax=Amycolatopsis saalfeldensis TaxID=394193 RepID=A0A1H8YCC9_9PSEU|nr:peptidoglycan-binding domain-containing protein [Amycolatopsis saalfeldensis]SEP49736.1 Putative peptidoglycan binding domain-containing protein [Amycolatopsis saalfeldensis]
MLSRLVTVAVAAIGILAAPAGMAAAAPAAPHVNNCGDGSRPLLKEGSRGDAVERAQCLLDTDWGGGLNRDGIFGPETRAWVVQFQEHCGNLQVDGEIGPQTWTRLYYWAAQPYPCHSL